MYREIDDYEILYMIQENNDYYELILEKYKPLIITICKQRLNGIKEMGYELEDLMQIANMAVYEAIKTYSEYENAKFYTYVAKCIHNKLNTELRNNSSDKKKALNTAISYDANIPGTNTPLIDILEDKTVINPYQYLDIKELKDKYIYYLNSLPFEVAGVYQLRLQGFNQSEIQTLLNINELTFIFLLLLDLWSVDSINNSIALLLKNIIPKIMQVNPTTKYIIIFAACLNVIESVDTIILAIPNDANTTPTKISIIHLFILELSLNHSNIFFINKQILSILSLYYLYFFFYFYMIIFIYFIFCILY